MKRVIICAAMAVVMLCAGFVAGCHATMKAAVPAGLAGSGTELGYIISYRYGDYWINEFYPQTLPEKEAITLHHVQ